MSMKQMEVSIMGQIYLLACPEGGDAVLAEAVTRVDREMFAIRDAALAGAAPCWACSNATAAVGDRAAAVCKAELGDCAPDDADCVADCATACISATEPCCPASSCSGTACP